MLQEIKSTIKVCQFHIHRWVKWKP